MSYPRNAASPPTVTLGAIVQISDGAVQTSGASVRVKTGTGAWGAGSGTLACDSTSGIWTYLPTQAETDDTHFSVAAYKTGCVPVGATVITSASATAGYAGVDWAKVANPTTTLGLTGTTIAPTQKVDVETIKTQSVTCAASVTVSPYVGSTGAAVNGTTVNTLASHDPGATLGTSTLTQSQVTGGAYALNSASFAFNAALDFTTTQKAATLARVTLVDTTTTNSDMRGTDGAALATHWTSTRAGYLDSVILAANANQRTVSVTGSQHIAADIHELQTGVISAGDFAAGAIDAAALAADAATEISTAVAAIDIDGKTLQAALRIIAAVVAGKISGAGTSSEVFVGLDGATTRATVTADSSGNRSAVTYA